MRGEELCSTDVIGPVLLFILFPVPLVLRGSHLHFSTSLLSRPIICNDNRAMMIMITCGLG